MTSSICIGAGERRSSIMQHMYAAPELVRRVLSTRRSQGETGTCNGGMEGI